MTTPDKPLTAAQPRIAPTGAIWVCGACGKTARDRYGDPGTSWDESCMLNAILCDETSLVRRPGGPVTKAEPFAGRAALADGAQSDG
jgi:hypothetical protein